MPTSESDLSKTIWALVGLYLAQGIAGMAFFFFWAYAIWILFKQDRVLDACAAAVVAPIGAIYGFLRFFGFL